MASDSASEKCTYCHTSYSFIKRKRHCQICQQYFCGNCAPRIRVADQSYRYCIICQEISNSLTPHEQLLNIKVKHLQCYLKAKNIDYSLCTEKSDLIDLIKRNQHKPFDHRTRSQQNLPSSDSNDNFSASANPLSNLAANLQTFFNNATETFNAAINESPTMNTRPEINRRRSSRPTSLHRPSVSTPPEYNWRTRTPPPARTATVSSEPPNANQTQTNTPNVPSTETSRSHRKSLSEISSEEQIELLTSRELKEILARNFVDYKGCVEKLELLDKVRRLYRDRESEKEKMSAQNSEQTVNSDHDLCKICLDAIADCVFLNCGHMVSCTNCGKLLAECPICRANIVRVVRVFKS